MAKNNSNEDTDSIANCEDEEMLQFKKHSLNAVTFHIVYNENDLETPHKKGNSFKPDMAHQIFGDTEMIFGYKNLNINLFYLHNSSKCCVDIHYKEKIVETKGCKADNLIEMLNPWLPANYKVNKEDFKKDIAEENHSVMHGEVIHTFEDEKEKNKTYKVTICNNKDEAFKEFHQRFETFIVWFIDGANYIDLDDERWTIFYVYEEHVDPDTKKTQYTPIGFCTVYRFFLYPDSTRPRISQFFILPTHQRKGVGTKLYTTVYNYLKDLPEAGDITVEEPTVIFQRIRDFCDSLRIYKELQKNNISINTQNQKTINELLRNQKICKRQAQRVFDVLECFKSNKNGYAEYRKFTDSIKMRITNEIEKETRGSKRLCNLERAPVISEPVDKQAMIEAEYNRYIDSLEWPTNRLRAYLDKTE